MSETVTKINAFFRSASKSDVEQLRKKIILSKRQNRIFEMYYIVKHDRRYIADMLFVSESTVSQELKSIRKKIINFL